MKKINNAHKTTFLCKCSEIENFFKKTFSKTRIWNAFCIFYTIILNRFTKIMIKMQKLVYTFLNILLSFTPIMAQVKVYKGNSKYNSDVFCTVKSGKVYSKTSSYNTDILCNISKNKVYKSTSSYNSDVLFTIRDGKVYKGNSNYNSDILWTIRDGKLYKGTSTYNSDILANIKSNKVYSKTSNYNSDVLYTFDGFLTIEEFVAVWYVFNYVY